MIGLVLSCEHASSEIPGGEDLGVLPELVRSQAGWDPGALDIARALATVTGAPLHAGRWSRMWVDLNRAPDHPGVIPEVCYGAAVPGNGTLTVADRVARLARDHTPYWDAVRRDVAAAIAGGGRCLLLSSHSFDPELDPPRRTFDVGVLFDPASAFEAELAHALLAGFAEAGLAARANEPYHGVGPAISTSLRAEFPLGAYAGIQIETSHALVARPDGGKRVADAIATVLGRWIGS